MPVTVEAVRAALAQVVDSELRRDLVELEMVGPVVVDGNRVDVTVLVPVAEHPQPEALVHGVHQAVGAVEGVTDVRVELVLMTDDERSALRQRLQGDPAASAGSQDAHGHAEGRAIRFADPSSPTRVLLIASGKGGVGKSSVTVNLAVALAQRGKRVGVIDADVWGFSVPQMLGVEHPPMVIDPQLVVPPEAHGVRCVSMGFFIEDDQAVIWRGPMLHKALEQFLTDFWWDDPDYLIIDLPPGTGDISLSLAGFLPKAEAYVVTTPQPAAQRVAQRSGVMFQNEKIRIQVRGVVENMSWFTGDDQTRYELFGAGGGQLLADRLEVPLLAQVPFVPALREGGDVGQPIVIADPEGDAALAFAGLARVIDDDLAPTRRYRRELKLG